MSRKLIAFVTILFIIVTACVPYLAASADTYNYVTNGLEALYVGNNNTGSGQDKNATVWKDLSGKGRDITDVPKNDNNYFTDTGYHLDTQKVYFPAAITNVINGQEFTVEMVLGDITPKGTQFLTFINCANDNFSLFRRNAGDKIEVKSNNSPGDRAEATGGLEYFKNSTVTVTYKVGGNCTIYVDGEKIAEKAVSKTVNANTDSNMWFGHDDATRNYATEFRSIRFYSRELTANEVKANYDVDKAVLGKPYSGTSSDTSSVSSNSSSSALASSSSSSSASSTSKPASSSSTSSTTNPTTGDYFVYTYAIMGVAAFASIMVVVRNRRRA